jgi:hypothetical protein
MRSLMIPHTTLGHLISGSLSYAVFLLKHFLTVLDPQIGYDILLLDCGGDLLMQRALKHSLPNHYQTYYAPKAQSTANPTPAGPPVIPGTPQQVDVME